MDGIKKDGRGGARAGAGRKNTGRVTKSISVLPEEWEKIKKLAAESGMDASRFIVKKILG